MQVLIKWVWLNDRLELQSCEWQGLVTEVPAKLISLRQGGSSVSNIRVEFI